jgi:hypothetical protein
MNSQRNWPYIWATLEEEEREKIETSLVSMFPMLEWTIHTAGQKCRGIGEVADKVAGLAIFNVEKLRQTSDTTIFRVSDVLCTELLAKWSIGR